MDLQSGKKIHDGKFSIVYLVDHKGEKFVVKQLHPRLSAVPEARSRFKAEAQLPNFPGINPKTIDYQEYIGNCYIVREYIPGITLKEVNNKYSGSKYHSQYKDLYLQLCDKLGTVHSNGYIHGDIKPSNILLVGNDFKSSPVEIRLLDLGLAVKKDQLPPKKTTPLPFSMMYSAPELMLNEPSMISELTDLFSVGICLYESFSGEVPYKENHPAVLLQMMLSVPLPKRKKIPDQLFNTITVLTTKPSFQRPVAHYLMEEVKELLRINLQTRSEIASTSALKEKLASIF
jgi:serine/threonine protein kinase